MKQLLFVLVTNMNGISRLDLKQLRILEALLQERNLSRVAEKVGLTQQAISEQLRKLREVFDDRLFIRQGNGMVPTPVAEQLGGRISSILKDVESLLTPIAFDPATYKGIFSISATDYAIQSVLPQLLEVVRKSAPELKVIVRDFETDNLNQLMVAGEIDLALTFPDFIPDDLPYKLLFEEQHVCVAGKKSSLKGKSLTLADVAELPQLIISPSRANLKGSHDEWFAMQGLKRNIVMSIPSFSAAPDIIAATNTIAFYPSRLLPNKKVIPLKLDTQTPKFEVIAAWHSRSNHSQLHMWMVEQLMKLFK
ncbi:LysR family transcriptional regulator [Microbulbifer sp. ZKSA002]|uniref:LysR family transcriptional regulator n=1 Tax=Microbulbifer sp. ZKSA002 TaxID=3243388 RepID=UPI00403A7510